MSAPDPEWLAARYAPYATIVRRGGRAYPAAYEARAALAVRRGPAHVDSELRAAGAPYVAAARERLPWLYDGETQSFVAYDDGVLTVGPGRYFDRLGIGEAIRADTGARERADAAAGGRPLHDGAGRGAAPGVTTIAVFEGAFILGRRRGLPVSDGDWHVVPAGTMEVTDRDPIAVTTDTELREELGLEPGAWRLLGIGWDLERLLPEVVLRADLDVPLDDVLREAPLAEHDELRPVALDALEAFWADYPPDTLSPPGAAAVALLEDSLR